MTDKVIFELDHKAKFFLPELVARIFVTGFICFTYESFNQKTNLINECLIFCCIINVVISFISLYYGYRRVLGIKSTIKSRLSNHPQFKNVLFSFTSDFKNSDYPYLVLLQSFIFSIAITLEPFLLCKGLRSDTAVWSVVIVSISSPLVYIYFFLRYKSCFMNHKILNLSMNGKKLTADQLHKIRILFEKEKIESTHYQNDNWLLNYRKKLNEYRQRVDTLLIEAVFIGTLTFATFVQLTSPESIASLPVIQSSEDNIQNISNNYDSSIPKWRFMNMFDSFADEEDSILRNTLLKKFFLIEKINIEYDRSNLGYFQNWVINRKLKILRSYYLGRKDKKWLLEQIINKSLSGSFEKQVKESKEKVISAFNELTKGLNNSSKSVRKLTFYSLVREIDNLDMDSLRKYPEKMGIQLNKIDKLAMTYSKVGSSRFKSLIKKNWDEQEFLFLIAVGSILCSVCFIAVLLKRFPIIVGIENFASEINKAMVWNNREEHMQLKKVEFEIESKYEDKNMKGTVLDKYNERRDKYTERLQSQLAICELEANRLETNINTVSILRTFGLLIFYFVLSISTLMVDYSVSVFLFVILIYSIFGAQMMNEGSVIYSIYIKIFKRKVEDQTIFLK